MNVVSQRRILSINTNLKVYDLEDSKKDSLVEASKEYTDLLHSDEKPIIPEDCLVNGNLVDDSEGAEVQYKNTKLFKKTLSRIVLVQLVDSILSDVNLKDKISTEDLIMDFQNLLDFIIENNIHEWGYFKNKQIAKNFIRDLFIVFNKNYSRVQKSIKEFCQNQWETYVDGMYSSIIQAAMAEFILSKEKESEKDYKRIILNEYLLVSEHFLNDNEIKFINGILNTLFEKECD